MYKLLELGLPLLALLQLAASLYEQCNHHVELQAGHKIYINSPFYPGQYPSGSSCRYTVQAPTDYVLQFKCELELLTSTLDQNCQKEVFHYNAEGDELLTSSEYFCGSGKFERKSFLNRAVISYISKRNEGLASALVPKLRDKLTTKAVTTTTTTTTTTSTTKAPSQAAFAVQEAADDFTNEVLHVLQDVGVSDAFAYVAALLYNEPLHNNHGQPIASYLTALPGNLQHTRAKPKTYTKRAKIVSNLPSTAAPGSGRFSCLVQAIEPTCECGWSLTLKIASPTAAEAALNEFPSMAGVLTKKQGKIFCGAAIIHQRYLLSAAHCFVSAETNSAELLRIVVGEHDLSNHYESLYTRQHELSALIKHEQFIQANGQLRNDIALLRTSSPIVWNRSVGPACLPLHPVNGKKLPLVGQQVQAAGWGTTFYGGPQSQRLLKTTLDVIDVAQCRRNLQSTGGGSVPAHSFCTYTPDRDTCQYDSGGALYERSSGRLIAVGIVSYGYGCATSQPSVNTRVASFVKWIKSKTPEVNYCNG